MIINTANLDALRVGFKTNFQAGLGNAASMYARVATVVPSTTGEELYGWLANIQGFREWIGPRQVMNLSEIDYRIKNRSWEQTIGVDRDHIRDDKLGTYAPLFSSMGEATANHPDELIFPLLKDGWNSLCFDRQNYFDFDHPVIDTAGNKVSVANTDGGNGTPWFLLCTRKPLKPLIFQDREAPSFVAKDDPRDSNVFMNREFIYGAEARRSTGYGFWQMAWGSRQGLDAAHYAAARAAVGSFKGDHGRPLGLVPDLLVVPPALEGAANKILKNGLAAGGETNEWIGTAEVLVCPWLA